MLCLEQFASLSWAPAQAAAVGGNGGGFRRLRMRRYGQRTKGVSRLAGTAGGLAQSPPGRHDLSEGDGKPELAVYSSLRRGWFFGSEEFREKLLGMLAKRSARIEKANGYHGPQLNDYAEKRARELIRAALEHFGTDLATLRQARKGDWRKGLLAAMIQKETTMRLDWITEQLNMGTRAGTCRLAAKSRKRLAADRALRREVETITKRAILNG